MKLFFCLTFLWISVTLIGQDTLLIFDRPGIADSPYIVPGGSCLIETGIGFTSETQVQDLLFPSLMIRKRLFGSNELRIATSTFPQSFRLINDVTNINPYIASIGVKQKLFREKNGLPETAFMINSYVNFASDKRISLSNFLWEFQLLFQSNVSEWFGINYNVGYIHHTTQNLHYINQSTCFNFQLTQRLGAFIESFNYFSLSENNNEFCFDLGLTFLLKQRLQFDISYIANNYTGVHYGTVLTGFSLGIK